MNKRKLLKQLTIYPHTINAYECVKKRLAEGIKRTCYVAATGVGKYYLALLVMWDNPDKDVLFVTSMKSNAIKSKSKAEMHFEDASNITFEIYTNVGNIMNQRYDIIILDEFHRAGAPTWNDYVLTLLENNPEAIVIGTSATPVRYLDNNRDMAEELFGGDIAKEINLRDAILMGILPMPEHYICGYKYEEMISSAEQSLQKRKMSPQDEQKATELLKKLKTMVQKAGGIKEFFDKYLTERDGHYVIFCKDVTHLSEIEELLSDWFGKTELAVYKIYTNNEDDNEQVLNAFEQDRSDKLHLLLCVDMLNEGVHLDSVTGVIMLRPTESINIYIQQIGRAFSASAKTTPKIYDLVDNAAILRPMRTFWSELERDYKQLHPEGDDREYAFDIEKIDLDFLDILDEFYDTINVSWEDLFSHAKSYYEAHGNLLVPKGYVIDGYNLGSWIKAQRQYYNKGKLSADKVTLLEDIGMVWKIKKIGTWQTGYEHAKSYYEEHGNLLVPSKYSIDGYNLGNWIGSQRQDYKQGELPTDKISLLESIGMVWSIKNKDQWQIMYQYAKSYYEEHGNLLVPKGYVIDGYNLDTWIGYQRAYYKQGNLPADKVMLLESIGMVWELCKEKWQTKYKQAKEYHEKYGNLLVPRSYAIDGCKLGAWIIEQRHSFKRGELPADKIALLENIDMVWDVKENQWQENYEQAKTYYEEHGNLLVPVSYSIDGYNLGSWIKTQRRYYNQGKLPTDKITLLESIDIVWRVKNNL